MAELSIDTLIKVFSDGHSALKGISFDVSDQEAVFLLGPSGAGKTTTLRLVAGLDDVTNGSIRLNGQDITSYPPRDRNLAMVYDKHSLFPHKSVFENLAYPLRIRRMDISQIRSRIGQVAETLQIEGLMDRYPAQLSGGQQQRVAIGRALVREANCYLLDEPISHLDAKLRAKMRVEFKRLQREFKATMLYVSHDQLEAMTMADRIVLINNGEIEQIAAPQTLFDEPDTIFAATFVGEPPMNVLPADLIESAGEYFLYIGNERVRLDADWIVSGSPLSSGRRYGLGIRPQQIQIVPIDNSISGRMNGKIFAVETLGSRVIFDIEVNDLILRVVTSVDEAKKNPNQIGSPIAFNIDSKFIYLFDSVTGRTVRQAAFTRQKVKRDPGR